MIADQSNYYRNLPFTERFSSSVLELPYVITHLRRSIDGKRHQTQYNPTDILLQVQEMLGDITIFSSGEIPTLGAEIGSGFSFTVYKFTTGSGEWVLKVGRDHAPVKGYLAPSHPVYTQTYNRSIQILTSTFSQTLPELIPQPHKALYINENENGTTVVIEPYIQGLPFREAHSLTSDERREILTQLQIFHKGCLQVRETYGLIPDIYREENFCIRRTDKGVFLTLVDKELIDKDAPSPIFNLMNYLKYSLRVHHAIRRLKRKA